MEVRNQSGKVRRANEPCQFMIYDEEFEGRYHGNIAKLITLARGLLLDSQDTEDSSLLIAKATQGTRSLLLMVDRDNYEFILRMPGGKTHLAGGNLASEMKAISVKGLEQMMINYLTMGKPIRIPGKIH